VHAELPNGTARDFANLHTTAFTPTTMTGTGVFHWQVRGNFPRTGGAPVSGPYTKSRRFTRTVGRPAGARLVPGRGVAFSWNPTPGVKSYRLQLSPNPDFAMTLENVFTNNTVFAPLMRFPYPCRTTLYWRVAAIDADQNRGGFSNTLRFRLSRGCMKKPKPPAVTVRR